MYQPRQAVKSTMMMSVEPQCTPDKFSATLLHSITVTHMLHLATRSYAHHMALGTLYENLGDLVDEVIEVWQGINQKLISFEGEMFSVPKDENQYVKWLAEFISNNRSVMGSDSQLQNLIDEIAAEVDRCNYKLNFLG